MVQVGVVVMFSITRTTYNAVSVHGSRRPRYNGAAVYITFVTREDSDHPVHQHSLIGVLADCMCQVLL